MKAHFKLHNNERNLKLIKVPKQINAGGHKTPFDDDFTQTPAALSFLNTFYKIIAKFYKLIMLLLMFLKTLK